MMQAKYYFLFFFVLTCAVNVLHVLGKDNNDDHSSASRSSGKKVRYNNTTKGIPSSKEGTGFFKLTALKILVLILIIILSGISIYYFFIFYPILCRKERNYDVVEHSRDTTPSPNTEKM